MNDAGAPLFDPVPREALPYCAQIAPIPRLMVRVDPQGRLLIKGRREEITALITALERQGVIATLEYLSFCG
jgi:hypothetical protein